jgi:pimeloyl-ACP methyl ester carboxylesterase
MMTEPVDLNYYTIGSGFPLVLLHGWSADGLTYALQVPLAYKYRLILPDLRGHGRSPKPRTSCNPAMLAADVNRLLEKLGIEKAIMGGGSFGGLVALQFILDYPQRVEALILSDTTSNSAAVMPFMDMMLPVLSGPNPIETLRSMISKLAKASGMTKTPAGAMMIEGSFERFADIDPISLLEVSRGMKDFDVTQRLFEIKVPTLIIAAKKDMAIPFKYTEALHQGISGSECVVIKTDHGTLFFRPDEWNKAVQSFLQRIGH